MCNERHQIPKEYYNAISAVSEKFIDICPVIMPPTWRKKEESIYTFVRFHEELDGLELIKFFEVCSDLQIENPRPLSNELLTLSSLFHPSLYMSFANRQKKEDIKLPALVFTGANNNFKPATVRYYLQSLMFLAGCTLSAAVVQERFSTGTIESKLDRLWQLSKYSDLLSGDKLGDININKFVMDIGFDTERNPFEKIIAIKNVYGKVLGCLGDGLPYDKKYIKAEELTKEQAERFGFIPMLKELLGNELLCILAYGSSVTSENYSDYDLVVLVKDSKKALMTLAAKSPRYNNKDINLSIYDESDFMNFQALSGDNLDCNTKCIYGDAEIPAKYSDQLMLRNFSFAFIRLRQLLGMAGHLAINKTHGGLYGKTNLYEYFIKIPMHIMKGVRSIAGDPISKEYLNKWIDNELGYNPDRQLKLVEDGKSWEAISNAYHATWNVIKHLNQSYNVYTQVPHKDGDVWKQPENIKHQEIIE